MDFTSQHIEFDCNHLWHPYSAMSASVPFPIVSAEGVYLHLADGRRIVDGMSSWWAAIHGYNHPQLNQAVQTQLKQMAHVMFGGLTHRPAVELGEHLLTILPKNLDKIFFCDSGSVAVEIAIKMALQYWQARRQTARQKMLSIRRGYHGDTFAAMSVSDPDNGMHNLFSHILPRQVFAMAPACGEVLDMDAVDDMAKQLQQHGNELAAVILEPVVQGAGGMRIYNAEYLKYVRELCDEAGVLLIFDEIATGFGRTGRMFACEHAGIAPDIMCIGKSLSAGYLTLAAAVCSAEIAQTISNKGQGVLMHGPTYMANPLACAVACANLDLLATGVWQSQIAAIEAQLLHELTPCQDSPQVKAVRVKGAIGVVEMHEAVDVSAACAWFVEQGVWLRPFMNLIYLMPPYIIKSDELAQLTLAVNEFVKNSKQ